jgi:hypothetical protein
LDESYQKKLVAGDVLVRNNTKSDIVIDPDFWIYPNGEKESFVFAYPYTIKAGTSAYLFYNKKQVVAKKFQGYVKTDRGKKLFLWEYTSGVHLTLVVNEADLP